MSAKLLYFRQIRKYFFENRAHKLWFGVRTVAEGLVVGTAAPAKNYAGNLLFFGEYDGFSVVAG